MERGGDERFARASRSVEDDVLLFKQLQDGRLLRGVKLEIPLLDVFEEAPQQHVVARPVTLRNQIVKRRHRSSILSASGAAEKAHPAEVTSDNPSRHTGWAGLIVILLVIVILRSERECDWDHD